MTRDTLPVLSAFVDGEAVDPRALAEALATPSALETLVDYARLRAAVADDPSEPSPGFYASMERTLGLSRRRPTRRMRATVLGVAAALLLGIGLVAGLALRSGSLRRSESLKPPPPTREVRFTEGVDWFRSSS
jgi:hypothetical protein